MSDKISGGCLCGEVRYETMREPAFQLLCYCTDCKTVSGAAGYAVYGVPIDSIVLTSETPGQFDVQADSGRTNSRWFCTNCGTRIWAQLDELGIASVNGVTLDERDHFQPTANHCTDNAPK